MFPTLKACGRKRCSGSMGSAARLAAAETVTERAARDEKNSEAENIGIDRPFEQLHRRAEIGANDIECRGDDLGIERDQERGGRSEGKNPALPAIRG